MVNALFLTALTCCVSCYTLAMVTVLKQVQIIYDTSPKLRIRGSGFDVDNHDITLEIGSQGQPSLVADKDYMITTDEDGDGLILKLLNNKKWVDLTSRVPPAALVLSSVQFKSDPEQNLLVEPVIVAQVLATPTVFENDLVLYQSASNELRINGTGFVGAKKVDLYFNPPLIKEVAYEDVSHYTLSRDQVVLRLRHGYSWRGTPGPLCVIGVDTGGGPMKTNGDQGVEVADVEANMNEHFVTVQDTADTQLIYNDEPEVAIRGSNFNEANNNLLRFSNGLLGNDVNYTTVFQSVDTLRLRLSPGSHWRKNLDNLPGTLTLIAVNAGGGYVAVGPLNADKGRDIATVFERPAVFSSNAKVFRTYSHELHIRGSGFPLLSTGFKPKLQFSTWFEEGSDYTLNVYSRSELVVRLIDSRSWRSSPGTLLVTHINTRGDPNGWVVLPGNGVVVAEVVADVDPINTGGVQIYPSGAKVYQSAASQSIVVYGAGFQPSIAFTFDPPLTIGVNYTVTVSSRNKCVLELISGSQWRSVPGPLLIHGVRLGGIDYPLGDAVGTRIAAVLQNPVVLASTTTVLRETQTKVLEIMGFGFSNIVDTTVGLSPTPNAHYRIIRVTDTTITVLLIDGQSWIPPFADISAGDSVVLEVWEIDTGAGSVALSPEVQVAAIIADREGVVCDDSCEFSFDGVCDDGSDQSYPLLHRSAQFTPPSFAPLYDQNSGSVSNDTYSRVYPCRLWTDCTDCGGVDSGSDWHLPSTCTNRCVYARDGVCDDPRGTNYCLEGTDCQDCGPVGADNFTRTDDQMDDDYRSHNDDQSAVAPLCTDTCVYAKDGVCDDTRGFGYCGLGTDCQDCGPSDVEIGELHSIIQSTGDAQIIYNDQPVIFVKGALVHPVESALRWSNRMRGGVDYELRLVDHTTFALRRSSEFKWDQDSFLLSNPTVLYLEAVDDGVGTTKFFSFPGRGMAVATILEKPSIEVKGSPAVIYRTKTRDLHLQGTGFPAADSGYKVHLQLDPPLRAGVDYIVRVLSRTDLYVTLKTSSSAWRTDEGLIYVTAINTSGEEDGWVWFSGQGLSVAEVRYDPGEEEARVVQAWLVGGSVVLVLLGMFVWYRRRVAAATAATPVLKYKPLSVNDRDVELTSAAVRGSRRGGHGEAAGKRSPVGDVCAPSEVRENTDIEEGPGSMQHNVADSKYIESSCTEGIAVVSPLAAASIESPSPVVPSETSHVEMKI